MTSSLCHMTSQWGSSHIKSVIQSAAFPPRHTHTHVRESQNIPQIPHSSSSFWRGNILHNFGCSIPWNTLCMILFHLHTHSKCYCILRITRFVVLHVYTPDNQIINLSDDNLELKVRGHFDKSMLWSAQGLCMGDICFAEIQTIYKMRVVSFHMFLQFVKKGVLMQTICLQTATVIPQLYSLPSSLTHTSWTLSMWGLVT